MNILYAPTPSSLQAPAAGFVRLPGTVLHGAPARPLIASSGLLLLPIGCRA
ncbi:hypothetical protein [Castellaniella sp.]|uniref:hypothetical protein n=1 Tax=Castellaniella sp. TaxID=1955812 RepID=UPI002AFFFFD5|nr:hypothetical protein [Castellaniella sp.]